MENFSFDSTIDAKYLTQIFKPIKMIDKLTFYVGEKALKIHGLNPARSCMIDINIEKRYFKTYKFYRKDEFMVSAKIIGNCTNELEGIINFKISDSYVILSNADSVLNLTKHENDYDTDFENIHEFDNFIKVSLKEMKKMSTGVNKYKPKNVKIDSSKERVKFTFSSNELKVSKEIKKSQQFKTPFVMEINAQLFINATKMFKFGENITIYHQNNYPLCIEYNLTKDNISLKHEKNGKSVVRFCTKVVKKVNRKIGKEFYLPIEIYIYIFSYVSVLDIFNFCTTNSKYLHIFSKYNCILWKILLKRDLGEDSKKITKSLKSRYIYIKGCGYVRIYIAPLFDPGDDSDSDSDSDDDII